MTDYSQSREKMIDALVSEVFGPEVIKQPIGTPIDTTKEINFTNEDKAKKYHPYYDQNSNQEILTTERPTQKYGAGVLYPFQQADLATHVNNTSTIDSFTLGESDENDEEIIDSKAIKEARNISTKKGGQPGELSDLEFDLSGTNVRFQSSMGISFHCEVPQDTKLIIENNPNQPCGIYQKKDIYIGGIKDQLGWWVRKDLSFRIEFDSNRINSFSKRSYVEPTNKTISESLLLLDFKLLVRPLENSNKKIITVCLINKTDSTGSVDEKCLFQSGFIVKICKEDNQPIRLFYPYPKSELEEKHSKEDSEEKVLDLIYRNNQTFSVGHGCAADWKKDTNATDLIKAMCLPIYEAPNITPIIKRKDGSDFETPMNILAGLKEGSWENLLNELVDSYKEWIQTKNDEINNLDENLKDAAKSNLQKCEHCLDRMKRGIRFLQENEMAQKAFQWTNEAILVQQLRSNWENPLTKKRKRDPEWDGEKEIVYFPDKYEPPDLLIDHGNKGKWRPFQLAFLLTTIQSSVEKNNESREEVELIFFPTGGGKTEAYLALSAFTSFYRRLLDSEDDGVQVIMRYTLRLLTAQQFTRASSLICSMEKIREKNENQLGKKRFSIGVWLGSGSTPNQYKGNANFPGALQYYKWLLTGNKKAIYPFLITKCPWCSSHIGQVSFNQNRAPNIIGLREKNNKVEFKCRNIDCDFESNLPIYVVDDDVYEKRPTILIGTVDKFARLTWEPKSKLIFGLDENGRRISSPPSLILQDELHLITGPLGSMCGLYEVIIEELCTDYRENKKIKPKMVCSTATIRSYNRQIKDLYNRNSVNLFPPLGLEVEDSFFAKYALDKNGDYIKPKKYIGLLTPNYPSTQTAQVRVYSRLLYSATKLNTEEQDPWFTLMNFFGSLRELGTTTTLIQVDIPDRLKLLRKRYNADPKTSRKLFNILELTSRVNSEKIPLAIDKLEISVSNNSKKSYPVDICLASNIIEVGIDIERLSLLTILGQPKTTSSYIQVSGRIGRNWFERPGLVCTLYGFRRPRDKSHFEKFKSYHQRLYAQVEPMSVTPFAAPVMNRALHGILVAYVRSFGDSKISKEPRPFPDKLINNFKEILLPRIKEVDENEITTFNKLIEKLSRQWREWEHDRYSSQKTGETDVGLMYPAGAYVRENEQGVSWSTPNTMRHIDAECHASITNLYRQQQEVTE